MRAYRYGPRKIADLGEELLSRGGRPAVPKIHDSVLRRIKNYAHLYPPVGLPAEYEVVTPTGDVLPPAQNPYETPAQALAVDEIRLISGVLVLDFTFMKTVGSDPKQRTGSYIGLFQLSKKEFEMYGSGNILDARDNAVAAALKFMTENILFEMFTYRTPTLNDIYLIHQQGVEGAVEHLSHPRRLAWQSMCATYEGKEKGEKWCKRAIWGNTLPAIKRVWKNVNKVTSAAFVGMWRQRVVQFYAQYSEAAAK